MHTPHVRVCIYCGSCAGSKPIYEEATRTLGTQLAQNHIGIVYGGGRSGLMGALANAALAADGEVTGVIPRPLLQRDLAHTNLSELIVVDDMPERKAQMAVRAQAFIGLPGGLGTLEELSEVLSWAQLDLHTKPIFLLNLDGYFTALIHFIEQAITSGFIHPAHRDLLRVAHDVDTLLSALGDCDIS